MKLDPARRRGTWTAWLALGLTFLAILAGRTALRQRPSPAPASPGNVPVTPSEARDAQLADPGSPGPGIVIGRLIDRDTGLAVRDAGVTVLELGRRSISLPDGRFRFDGLQPGRYTLVLGPAEAYVPRAVDLKVAPDGADLGILGLVPTLPPVPMTAADGGRLAACGDSVLSLEPLALPEDLALSFSCLERLDDLPVPPPAGRLPLAAMHLSPESLGLVLPGQLRVSLPSQPRYAAGVNLDLLRLDLDRALWRPAGTLTVTADGRVAEGQVMGLGDYLVAAPPFGAFGGQQQPATGLLRLSTSVSLDGTPADRVDPGAAVVYLDLSLGGLAAGRLQVRTVDAAGDLVFEVEQDHPGAGSLRVPMSYRGGVWPEGDYLSTVAYGDGPRIQSLPWQVAEPASASPPAAWIGSTASQSDGPVEALPPPQSGAGACGSPAGWWAYRVQPGDTLGALAVRTGSSVAALQAANCLKGDAIAAGQTLFVPGIVYRQKPPVSAPAPGWEGGAAPTLVWPPRRPAATAAPGGGQPSLPDPSYVKPTRPPDPTLAPRPTDPPYLPRSLPPPLPAPAIEQAPPPQPSPAPVQGAGSWKEPRGPEPTLAPRPGSP